jgi:hypothetical protein
MQGRIATPRTRRWRLASLSRPGRSGSAAALGRPNCSLPLPLGRLPPRAPLIRLPPRAALRTTHQCVRPALEQPATHNARPRQQRMRRPIRLPSLSVHPITIPRTPIPHRLSMTHDTTTTDPEKPADSPRTRPAAASGDNSNTASCGPASAAASQATSSSLPFLFQAFACASLPKSQRGVSKILKRRSQWTARGRPRESRTTTRTTFAIGGSACGT